MYIYQVQSSLVEMLRQMASQKLVSSECVRLYHVLPAFILQPLDTSLFAVFAYSLTSLGAEWKALIGESCEERDGGRESRGSECVYDYICICIYNPLVCSSSPRIYFVPQSMPYICTYIALLLLL